MRDDTGGEGAHVLGEVAIGDGAMQNDVGVLRKFGDLSGLKHIGSNKDEGPRGCTGDLGEEIEVDSFAMDGAGIAIDRFLPSGSCSGEWAGGVEDLGVVVGIDAVGDEVEIFGDGPLHFLQAFGADNDGAGIAAEVFILAADSFLEERGLVEGDPVVGDVIEGGGFTECAEEIGGGVVVDPEDGINDRETAHGAADLATEGGDVG